MKQNTRKISHFHLCSEYNTFLVKEDNNEEVQIAKNIWSAFVWTVLKYTKIRKIYGITIWKFLHTSGNISDFSWLKRSTQMNTDIFNLTPYLLFLLIRYKIY